MPGMLHPLPLPASAWASPLARLTWLAEQGWLAAPGPELHAISQHLWRTDPASALLFRCQRLAIEALRGACNQGLAHYLLPQMLHAERAAALPLRLDVAPLSGQDTGRGWRLTGLLPWVANAPAGSFTLVAPVRLGDEGQGWAALRGEEDGLDVLPPHAPDTPPSAWPRWRQAAGLGDVRCRAFFFREDEWLGDDDATPALQALDAQLWPDAWGDRSLPALSHQLAACLP